MTVAFFAMGALWDKWLVDAGSLFEHAKRKKAIRPATSREPITICGVPIFKAASLVCAGTSRAQRGETSQPGAGPCLYG